MSAPVPASAANALTPENIARLRQQMAAPPPPKFIAALPKDQQQELAEFVKQLLGRPSPADMMAKMADGMIAQGVKEAKDFEKFVSEVALPDIRECLSRIEAAQTTLTNFVTSNFKALNAIVERKADK
jgi:hypothetical protein